MDTTNLVVVLNRPQRVTNLGAAVRAMKNMGLTRLRLVRPAPFERDDLLGIAHRSEDILDALQVFDTLDAALADAVFVAGTTSRPRGVLARTATPREAAPELLARTAAGPVALLFGPEDNGLTNDELDRCHLALTIPTDPAYPSLNLAQAVLLVAYELRMAATSAAALPGRGAQPTPEMDAPGQAPARAEQLEELFGAAERALWGIEFFKAGRAPGIMRTLRSLVHRAEPTAREAKLLIAMCVEVLNFLRRHGVEPGRPPADRADG